jgi:phosphoglycerate dehydrogenase-like enzyme
MSYTVFYLNPRATDDVLAMVREQMPAGWQLLSPSHPMEFARELAECDFLVVADHPVTADHLALAPKLRMIQHQGVGYERIDLAACRARGIPLALAPQGTSIGVAEHTLLLILASFKRLVKAATGASSGRWMQWELRQGSFELAGKTLGLVGLGRIGREVAKRALAFDVRVGYFDPFVPHPADLEVRRAADLDVLRAAGWWTSRRWSRPCARATCAARRWTSWRRSLRPPTTRCCTWRTSSSPRTSRPALVTPCGRRCVRCSTTCCAAPAASRC